MMLISLTSIAHSPGVSTAALALGWSWPRAVVVSECDPLGGQALSTLDPGGQVRLRAADGRWVRPGVMELMQAARAGSWTAAWAQHLVELAHLPGLVDTALGHSRRWLLPGVGSPREAESVSWQQLATLFRAQDANGCDVLADCGRLRTTAGPGAVLTGSDLTVLCVRSDRTSLTALWRSIEVARAEVDRTDRGDDGLVAVVVGAGRPYSRREIDKLLAAESIEVAGELPWDPTAAQVLTLGAERGHRFARSPLFGGARELAGELGRRAWARHVRLTPGRPAGALPRKDVAPPAGRPAAATRRTERLRPDPMAPIPQPPTRSLDQETNHVG